MYITAEIVNILFSPSSTKLIVYILKSQMEPSLNYCWVFGIVLYLYKAPKVVSICVERETKSRNCL